MKRTASLLAGVLSFAGVARVEAQPLQAEALVSYPSPAAGLHTLVIHATAARAVRDDLEVASREVWRPFHVTINTPVQLVAGASRTVLVPAPWGSGEGFSLRLDTLTGDFSVPYNTAREAATGAPVALLGVGNQVGAALLVEVPELSVGTVASSFASGEALVAPLVAAWGGTRAIVAASASLVSLSADAKATLGQWVHAGGVLVVSEGSASDLRDPWLQSLMQGEGADGDWGRTWGVGLGAVGHLRLDLTQRGWSAESPEVRGLARSLRFASAAAVAPGSGTLSGEFLARSTTLREFLEPPRASTAPLGPLAAILVVYTVAVGLWLRRNRTAREPLKIFLRLPLVAFGMLGVSFGALWLFRSHESEVRLIAMYDLASGDTASYERVFAVMVAGRSQTLSLLPPRGHYAVVQTGSSTGSGTLLWDGARLGPARARLAPREHGAYYAEGPTSLGGTIRVEVLPDTRLRVTNTTPLSLHAGSFVTPNRHGGQFRVPVPPLAPGASVTISEQAIRVGGGSDTVTDRVGLDATAPLQGRQLLNLLPPYNHASRGTYITFADAPSTVLARFVPLGFRVIDQSALLRVAEARDSIVTDVPPPPPPPPSSEADGGTSDAATTDAEDAR